jgi:predicted nucleic acid-binding protein
VLRDILAGGYSIQSLTQEDYARTLDVCIQYADSDIGFVDAAVLAIVERLGETKLATLDHRHFGMLRPRHVAALTLLP